MSRRDKRPEDKKPAAPAAGTAETALVQSTAPAAAPS